MTGHQRHIDVRRPVVVIAFLLVAVAVLLVALRSWLDRPVVNEIATAAPAVPIEQSSPLPEPEPDIEQAESVSPVVTEIGILPPVAAPLPRYKVVLLPARAESADPAAEALVSSIRQATLRGLLGMGNVDVVDVNAVELAAFAPPNAGSLREDRLLYLAVSRRYESPLVAEIAEQASPLDTGWMIAVQIVRPNGSGGSSRLFSKNGAFGPGSDPESAGMEYAQRIARDFGSSSNSNVDTTAARNTLLDATRPEQERLQAFARLDGEAFDSATLAAVVDLATRSASAGTRQQVWSMLRRATYDPALAQPLSFSLLSDLDPVVRQEAALALAAYLSTPGSRAVLENAARNDSSGDVRLAARMAMMDYDEQQDFKRDTLLDRTLTPAQRLAPMTIAGGPTGRIMFQTFGPEQVEEAQAYAEIVRSTDNPELKVRALQLLQSVSFDLGRGARNVDPELTRVFIESAEVADDRVRRAALSALRQHAANPEARSVLEAVVQDEPALAAELRLAEALEPSRPALFTPPPPPSNAGRGQ